MLRADRRGVPHLYGGREEVKRSAKKKPGAKPLELSAEAVVALARGGRLIADIAAELECSRDTIERRFRAEYDRGRHLMRGDLRAKQVELAVRGNPIMLIWLGKQKDILDQREPEKGDAAPPPSDAKPYSESDAKPEDVRAFLRDPKNRPPQVQ